MKGTIEKLSREYDPLRMEREVLDWWESSKAYLKTRARFLKRPKYYFLDGPPYVNAAPHVGTAWNKTLKDTTIRFWRMRGFNVRDQPGYDCHGLPVEVMVEKLLKLTSKKDIEEKVGIGNFIAECKKYADENARVQTQVFKDLGIWMDWEHPYLTYKDNYVESVWWTVKRASEKDLLSKGLKVVHWCPRCETALAGYEVTDEYRMVRDPSVYVKMPLEDQPEESILIWTTTPWTLPANMGVMVHPEETYAKVEVDGKERLILAKKRLETVLESHQYRVLEEFQGEKMEGTQYRPPLLEETGGEAGGKLHRVLLSQEHVSMLEGTGAVHTAPGHGEEDFEVGQKYGIPAFSPVDETGRFTREAGKYAGMPIREANKVILDDLRKKNLVWKESTVEHSYPHCWRCKTPLLLRATRQWFVKVTEFKKDMIRENRKVEWVPEWAGSKRFHDWLTGARDWVISRQRYWGVPIPIWQCQKCDGYTVIGSKKELLKLAVKPPKKFDLHRNGVDQILVKCRKCGGMSRREPDVVDVWLDSACASWASLGYPSSATMFKAWWPADVIIEAHDQTRGWFYSQLGSSMVVFDRSPYKRVLMHGHTLNEKGEKFSKSKGNYVGPREATEKYGRDNLRFYLLRATVWEDFRFSWTALEAASKDLLLAWNVYSFATLYLNLDRFNPARWSLTRLKKSLRPEDRWVLSRTEGLKKAVTKSMEVLEVHRAARALASFMVDDLSHWYIRLVRRRFWQEKENRDKLAAYSVLYNSLRTWLVLAAPFVPFITEKVYRESFRAAEQTQPLSVHMLDWPKPKTGLIDKRLEDEMKIAQQVSSATASARQSKRIKLRQPVSSVLVVTESPAVKRTVKDLRELLLQQANAKEVRLVGLAEEEKLKRLLLEPNFKGLGPVFRQDTGRVAEALRNHDARRVYEKVKKGEPFLLNVEGHDYEIKVNMVSFREEMPENYAAGEFLEGRVYVDLTIPDELVMEGFVRDVVRRLQEMRKRLDLPVDSFVEAYVTVPETERMEWLEDEREYLMNEVRVKSLHLLRPGEPSPKSQVEEEWQIDGRSYKMGISQLQ